MATAPKKCGKCDKTVYAAEEVRCLDKVWHKACLKCTTCGTTLNIKTAKGYEKMPYCNVHYPTPKSTAVTDNPEMQRIRQLQDVQSNVKYQKDFNESKGKVAETSSKRKDSASGSAAAAPDHPPEPTETPVADKEPSPAVVPEPEPTPKSLPSVKPEVEPPNPTETEAPQDAAEPSPPSDNVQQNEDSPAPSQVKYRVLYDYEATEADEITINVGDQLDQCENADEGWMRATNATTGQRGLIPSNYVEIVQ